MASTPFHQLLRMHARSRPRHRFLVTRDRQLSYAEVDARADALAAALAARGVSAGEPVAVLLPPCIETLLLLFALGRLGALFAPVNERLQGSGLAHQLGNTGAPWLVTDAAGLQRLAPLAGSLGPLREVLLLGAPPAVLDGTFRVQPFEPLLEAPAAGPVDAGAGPEHPMALFYTSGTTGPSKAVIYLHGQAHATALPMADQLGPQDTFYMCGPFFHVALPHCLGAILIAGGTFAFRERFSASAFWDDVRTFGATATMLLGAPAHFLAGQPPGPDDRQHALRKVFMVPLVPQLDAFRTRFGVEVMSWFNMTEVSTPIHTHGFALADGSTCGRVRAGIQARVADALDRPVAPGEAGELLLRPDQPWEFSPGYWRNPQATVEAWRNLWFHTGDLVRQDAHGNFHFVDRLKDAIRRRGENISSWEVEAEVNAHPAVAESAALAIPSPATEDDLLVVAALRPGAQLAPEALIEFLEPRVAPHMLPRYVRIVDGELPKTPTGKIRKTELRDASGAFDREATDLGRRHGAAR